MTTTITRLPGSGYDWVDGYYVLSSSAGSSTSNPILVLGYETSLDGRNTIHDLIGGGIAVSLVGPRPRSGTVEYLYSDEAEAWAALEMHSGEATFVLEDTDRAVVGMTYVVDGSVGLKLDDETRDMWVVSVDYQEVDP